eukprot:Tbor_TRINITY_DN5189_c2_g12::TRINITY_DN5189_c2_g12_i1::g.25924::m.25924
MSSTSVNHEVGIQMIEILPSKNTVNDSQNGIFVASPPISNSYYERKRAKSEETFSCDNTERLSVEVPRSDFIDFHEINSCHRQFQAAIIDIRTKNRKNIKSEVATSSVPLDGEERLCDDCCSASDVDHPEGSDIDIDNNNTNTNTSTSTCQIDIPLSS